MNALKLLAALALTALLSACGGGGQMEDGNVNFAAGAPAEMQPPAGSVRVAAINVSVPGTLSVSEANRYYPKGDIVWREDPMGDRRAQVKAIFEDAMQRGTADLPGSVPAVLNIEVMRFHALTEKTRYTIGGIHAITFAMTLSDPATGAPLGPRRVIRADLRGFGGQQAVEAVRRGQTQKVRITAHLAHVIRTELSAPGGYRQEKLGIIQVLNEI